jgi:hypothetical protein
MGKKSTQQEQNEEPVDGVRDADLLEAANEGVVEVPEADMKALMELDNTIKSGPRRRKSRSRQTSKLPKPPSIWPESNTTRP